MVRKGAQVGYRRSIGRWERYWAYNGYKFNKDINAESEGALNMF